MIDYTKCKTINIMKIGLLSFHRNYNYGWNLQCYALMTVLKSMGHEVWLIDKRKFHYNNFWGKIKYLAKSFVAHFLLPNQINYEEEQRRKGNNIDSFFNKYINPRTDVITNKKGYKKLPHFDVLIVGSDQVWRKKLVNPIYDYFFDFIDYPAVIMSYAASFGVDHIEYSNSEVRRCGRLIQRFNAVSVREQSGIKLIHEVYKWKCNPVVMPDPTLLLTRQDYERIIGRTSRRSTNLFCYILDKTIDKENAIKRISSTYSLKINTIHPDELLIYPPIEEWLSSFRDADFIFTDSFHGCVFSIIFRKPFIVYGNIERGLSRFISLLSIFKQEHRLINSTADINDIFLHNLRNIDIEQINSIQNALRSNAKKYLFSNLNI